MSSVVYEKKQNYIKEAEAGSTVLARYPVGFTALTVNSRTSCLHATGCIDQVRKAIISQFRLGVLYCRFGHHEQTAPSVIPVCVQICCLPRCGYLLADVFVLTRVVFDETLIQHLDRYFVVNHSIWQDVLMKKRDQWSYVFIYPNAVLGLEASARIVKLLIRHYLSGNWGGHEDSLRVVGWKEQNSNYIVSPFLSKINETKATNRIRSYKKQAEWISIVGTAYLERLLIPTVETATSALNSVPISKVQLTPKMSSVDAQRLFSAFHRIGGYRYLSVQVKHLNEEATSERDSCGLQKQLVSVLLLTFQDFVHKFWIQRVEALHGEAVFGADKKGTTRRNVVVAIEPIVLNKLNHLNIECRPVYKRGLLKCHKDSLIGGWKERVIKTMRIIQGFSISVKRGVAYV